MDTLDAGSTEDLAGIVVNCGELREIHGRYTYCQTARVFVRVVTIL